MEYWDRGLSGFQPLCEASRPRVLSTVQGDTTRWMHLIDEPWGAHSSRQLCGQILEARVTWNKCSSGKILMILRSQVAITKDPCWLRARYCGSQTDAGEAALDRRGRSVLGSKVYLHLCGREAMQCNCPVPRAERTDGKGDTIFALHANE